jgi:PPOX class probable F420-dependent enzyme
MPPPGVGRILGAKEVVDVSTSREILGFESLADEPFVSITTFRRDGTEASTPVWFVSDDLRRHIFVATGAGTWKVRRIRRNPHVRVAACTARGKVRGRALDGIASLVDEEALVRRLQAEKYGWQRWLIEKAYDLSTWLTRKPAGESVFIEIVPRNEVVALPDRRAA